MKVLLIGDFAGAGQPLLERFLTRSCQIVACGGRFDEDRASAEIHDAEVIIGKPFTRTMAAHARKLRLIQSTGTGTDRYDLANFPKGVRLCISLHHERAMAEYVLLAMLALTRRLLLFDSQLRRGSWGDSCIFSPLLGTSEISGKLVGLIGFGHIAREVARLSGALGMRTQAIRTRVAAQAEAGVEFCGGPEDLPRLLATSDYLVVTCPLTPITEGLIGAAELAQMKRDAYLINVSRARIIQEAALYNALKAGTLAGAALDVWYRYPDKAQDAACFPSDYPFHDLENVIMTPHISCCTHATAEARWRDIAFNIDHLDTGESLRNEVTLTV
jgi:phosphoglycerate dehydrogenase-like enzyme